MRDGRRDGARTPEAGEQVAVARGRGNGGGNKGRRHRGRGRRRTGGPHHETATSVEMASSQRHFAFFLAHHQKKILLLKKMSTLRPARAHRGRRDVGILALAAHARLAPRAPGDSAAHEKARSCSSRSWRAWPSRRRPGRRLQHAMSLDHLEIALQLVDAPTLQRGSSQPARAGRARSQAPNRRHGRAHAQAVKGATPRGLPDGQEGHKASPYRGRAGHVTRKCAPASHWPGILHRKYREPPAGANSPGKRCTCPASCTPVISAPSVSQSAASYKL